MKALVTNKPPWEDRPYSLVSLWDIMIVYKAERFLGITQKLATIIRRIENMPSQNDLIVPSSHDTWRVELERIEDDCKALSLEFAIDEIQRITSNLKIYDYARLGQRFSNLYERLYDETKRNLFLYVPKEKKRFYTESHDKFGLDTERFPSAKDEIEEAGKCYATGRNTACVLHLMRILEIGLNALAKNFGIPYEHSNWDKIINQIPGKINAIERNPNKPPNWQDDRKFYSELASHFRFIKDAYRNYAMHVHERYDEGKAHSLYLQTSEFMRHLATKLSE